MEAFLLALLKSSLLGGLAWLVLSAVRLPTRRIFSQAWHYYAGLIPVLFFLGTAQMFEKPAGEAVSWMRERFDVALPVFEWRTVLENGGEVVSARSLAEGVPADYFDFAALIDSTANAANRGFAAIKRSPVHPTFCFLLLWLLGSAVFLWRRVSRYGRFRKKLLAAGIPLGEVPGKLPVMVCASAVTPMLVGVLKPVIVLPKRSYPPPVLAIILSHETLHWRRGDMLIRLIILLVNAVHWFNPLVYQISREMSLLCENACDEALARHMDKSERILYGEIILSAAAYSRDAVLCAGIGDAENLKRRLWQLLHFKKTKKSATVFSLLAACWVAVGSVLLAEGMCEIAPATAVESGHLVRARVGTAGAAKATEETHDMEKTRQTETISVALTTHEELPTTAVITVKSIETTNKSTRKLTATDEYCLFAESVTATIITRPNGVLLFKKGH